VLVLVPDRCLGQAGGTCFRVGLEYAVHLDVTPVGRAYSYRGA
jgi:hypothetical protein